jgi:hypothetical protein
VFTQLAARRVADIGIVVVMLELADASMPRLPPEAQHFPSTLSLLPVAL